MERLKWNHTNTCVITISMGKLNQRQVVIQIILEINQALNISSKVWMVRLAHQFVVERSC